jgi:hypothetical protein
MTGRCSLIAGDNMSRKEVFPFETRDAASGVTIVDTRLSTREYISERHCMIIENRMHTVDESLVDSEGRLILDSDCPSASMLKELAEVGHGEVPRHVNLRHMALLVTAGLATRNAADRPGIVAYDITDLGRKFVRDVLS